MTSPVRQRLTRRANRVRAESKSIVNSRNARVAIKAVITRPVAYHRRASVSKAFVYFVVMPLGKFRRDEPFDIKASQQSERPSASFILDVRDQVLGKEPRAGHLRQIKERPKQSRITTWKQEA